MINNNSVLAIVPARAGSKRVSNKNIASVAGKPLIAWTIEAAKASSYLDRVVLSTDSPEIAAIAGQYGCDVPFMRPEELALDSTPTMPVLVHALDQLPRYDIVVLLQPTSPLRLPIDIDRCIELCLSAPSSVSVTELGKKPEWLYTFDEENQLRPLFESPQPRTRLFTLNGAVYAAKRDWLLENGSYLSAETRAYFMPEDRSLDIDTERDMQVAHCLLSRQ